MPFYLRKSLTRGPIRLNLFKSGVGLSVGVKGLRLGIGSRGPYAAGGRYGVYYRQYASGVTKRAHAVPEPEALSSGPTPVERFDGAASTELSDDQVAADINQRLNAFRPSDLLWAAAAICALGAILHEIPIVATIAAIAFALWAIVQRTREAAARRISFTYDLNEGEVKLYTSFVEAAQYAAQSDAIWRIVNSYANRDAKYTAGAGTNVDRIPCHFNFNDPRIRCNIPTVWLSLDAGDLCFLPDRMLLLARSGVLAMHYADVQATARTVDFRENGVVPPDSLNVGTTWQYVNKNGGPEHRFSNNKQLPIQRYSDFDFHHRALAFQLEFSRQDAAETLARGLGTVAGTNAPEAFTPSVEPVRDAIAEVKRTTKAASIPFTMHLTGPSEQITAFLRSLSNSFKESINEGAAAIAEAKSAKPSDGAKTMSITEGLARCRQTLREVTQAIQEVTKEVEAHDVTGGKEFPAKIARFFSALASIERALMQSNMPAVLEPANAAFATMIDEMVADARKWTSELETQADGVGETRDCTVALTLTLNIPIYSDAIARCAENAISNPLQGHSITPAT